MPLAPIDPIRTVRLAIREVAAADLVDLMVVNGDPEVTRFLPYATWGSLADAEAWLERMRAIVETGSARQLVVARNDDGRAIGTMLIFKYDEKSARAELGYVLGRAYWGQGLMREGLLRQRWVGKGAAYDTHIYGALAHEWLPVFR